MEEGYDDEEENFEIIEEIELDDEGPNAELAYNIEEMTVDNEENIDQTNEDDEFVEERDDSDLTFSQHTASVFCVSMDPSSCSHVVSGGEDDKAFVWKLSDGKVQFTCDGHKDSVTYAEFSYDSKYVATADMSGLIKVWLLDSGDEVWSFETSDIEWLEWHHSAHVLFAGTADGEFWMWKIPDGACKTYQSHGPKTTCSRLLKDGKRICVGYGDGSLKLWDLKAGNHDFHVTGGYAHDQSVTCLDINEDSTVLASGSEEGVLKLTHIGNGKVLGSMEAALSKEDGDVSIEAVRFCSKQPIVATASLSGNLGIWDVTSQRLRHQCQHPAGVTQLHWEDSLVYTACLDGILRLWDARSGSCEREWHGHTAPILDMAVSRDSSVVVTSSDDATVKRYNLVQPGR
ncbi:Angio-associated migratory cell [Paramuricea clavata]|uniref:Angio-associated migratory cell protein n=2 Tax=Paramuricea clavata TaxID=317549 RepID=A0A6S7FXX9_PARCT|nr:Angio-associated migratory cell [Paramuricea clavata]